MLPEPPKPPPSRVIRYSLLDPFIGDEDEYVEWMKEPFWRRALGRTAIDRKRKTQRSIRGVDRPTG